ncbi:MAG: uncharacterized protein QOE11_1116 [Solirubrobacteraceae bacterium]|nr:uncharacterized protein [Solirubrobacteraceae bacterium]
MPAGRVASLHRWPVKSMAGEHVAALALDGFGATGDRTHAVFDVFKGAPRRIDAEVLPRLLAWAAAYPDPDPVDRDAPPQPIITAPDGTTRTWDDPELPAALAADLGRPLTLSREPRGQQDRPATVHITCAASLRALGEALGAPVDLRRFRPNIHLDLDAEPWAENDWIGRRLRVGEAELEVLEGCDRCAIPTRDPQTQDKWPQLLRLLAAERATIFGLIVRVLAPAVVRDGDSAELL